MTQQSHPQTYTLRKPKIKRHIYPIVHYRNIYNRQNMEATQMSTEDEWIKKLWPIYLMEYYSALKKYTFESVLMRWMNLEPIIQDEMIQKEKDKYHIPIHIYGIQKNGTEEFTQRATMGKRHIEQTHGHGERGGQDEMYGKSNMETYITICKIDRKNKHQ